MTQQVDRFRKLHRQPTPLILPNIWDAGGARLAQSLGAKAVATTSAGVAWSMGYSDDPGIVAKNIVAIAKAGASGINLEEGPDDPVLMISWRPAIPRPL